MWNVDPDLNRESLERELRECIIPEVFDAYLSAGHGALNTRYGETVSPPVSHSYDILSATTGVDLSRGSSAPAKSSTSDRPT
jgi:hypothetical protein